MPLPGSKRDKAMKESATIQEVVSDGEEQFLQEVNIPQYELNPEDESIDEVVEEPRPATKKRKKVFGIL